MYIPQAFSEPRQEELHRIIQQNPLGTAITQGSSQIEANHFPFLFDPDSGTQGVLLSHVSRANPDWKELKDGDDVLVIFHAANSYISPNWYPSKHEDHRQVPTWNYQVVHVRGKIRRLDSAQALRDILERMTAVLEARAGEARPWKLSDSQDDYIEQLLACVFGIQIEISSITGKSKLCQDETSRDRDGAATALAERSECEIAQAMRSAPIR